MGAHETALEDAYADMLHQRCTWPKESVDPTSGLTVYTNCNAKATIIFARHKEIYPRCDRHNTIAARDHAGLHGYDIHYLDIPEYSV